MGEAIEIGQPMARPRSGKRTAFAVGRPMPPMPKASGTALGAVRISRCVRDQLGAGAQAVVRGVQRRACQVMIDGGPLLMLSTPEVPLVPNGLAVAVAPALTLRDAGFRTGQRIR